MAPRKIKEIFYDALLLADPERTEFLARQCQGDEELMNEVGLLLQSHEDATEFLTDPWIDLDDPDGDFAEELPESIGGREILSKLGQGGFGVVFLGQQTEPVPMKVAIKVIRPGMASGQVIARFHSEQRALELMNHPHIAAVTDAGTTPQGSPYFVMEYVQGQTITAYANGRNLSVARRCELLREVCMAVQHAHEKGVIHRDIKPSNVLVAEVDGRPIPKVIDFGLAKAVRGTLTDRSALTMTAQIVGTPQYMSPEQVSFGAIDVDTRTDVYSLGALCYEVLSGSPPFAADQVRQASPVELESLIRDKNPPRPSSRVILDHSRQPEAKRLARQLKGDLDWIITKAMEKDRKRRYHTPAALAADFARYLAGRAVDAGPPGRLYRFGKLVARNRLEFGSAALIFVALIALLLQSLRAENQARKDQRETQKQASKFEAIAAFTESMLATIDPGVARGADTTLFRTMLSRAVTDLAEDPPVEVEAQIRLRTMIGQAFSSIAEDTSAKEQLEISVALAARELPRDHPLRLNATAALAQVLVALSDFEGAKELFLKVLDAQENSSTASPEEIIQTRSNLAVTYGELGEYEKARDLLQAILAKRIELLGDEHADTMRTRNNLATMLSSLNENAQCIELYEKVLAYQIKTMEARHPVVLATMNNLSLAYGAAGKVAQSLDILEKILVVKKQILPKNHPSLIIAMNNLASQYGDSGDPKRAIVILEEAIEMSDAKNGKQHAHSLTLRNNLGVNLIRAKQNGKAKLVLKEAAEGLSELLGPGHPNTLGAWTQLINLVQLDGDSKAAFEDSGELLLKVRKLPLGNSLLPQVLRIRGRAMSGLGMKVEAEAMLLEAFQEAQEVFSKQKKTLSSFAETLAKFYDSQADEVKKETWASKAKAIKAAIND